MAQAELLKFSNDEGLAEIFIPVREFECTGASAPFDRDLQQALGAQAFQTVQQLQWCHQAMKQVPRPD